ncbi:MAG: WD40/YVTN/BNR-like repeat-containing protein [Chloroflexota bacterium]
MSRLPLLIIGPLVVSLLLLTASTSAPALAAVRSQGTSSPPDWRGTGLSEPVWRIFTPSSGALLVRTSQALVRAADADLSRWNPGRWQSVSLPPHAFDRRFWTVDVDPTNHDTLYASSTEGLSRSTDGGTSWTVILPLTGKEFVQRIAISPANPNVLYLGIGNTGDGGIFKFLRSTDGGASWETLETYMNMTCGWGVPILKPHATDENRLFRAGNCYAGRDFYDVLRQSTDQGTSWTKIFGVGVGGVSSRDPQHPQFAFPELLVGGYGAAPGRYYLATHRDSRTGGGASVFRSDDDGQTWTEVYAYRPDAESASELIAVHGLAYDPVQPDTVYIGLNVYAEDGASSRKFVRAGVLVSTDGGASWSEFGKQTLTAIHDLELGIDSRNLFVATEQGLLYFPLE